MAAAYIRRGMAAKAWLKYGGGAGAMWLRGNIGGGVMNLAIYL